MILYDPNAPRIDSTYQNSPADLISDAGDKDMQTRTPTNNIKLAVTKLPPPSSWRGIEVTRTISRDEFEAARRNRWA